MLAMYQVYGLSCGNDTAQFTIKLKCSGRDLEIEDFSVEVPDATLEGRLRRWVKTYRLDDATAHELLGDMKTIRDYRRGLHYGSAPEA